METLTIPADRLKAGATAETFLNQPVLIPGLTGACGLVRAVERAEENGPVTLAVELGFDLEPEVAEEPAPAEPAE